MFSEIQYLDNLIIVDLYCHPPENEKNSNEFGIATFERKISTVQPSTHNAFKNIFVTVLILLVQVFSGTTKRLALSRRRFPSESMRKIEKKKRGKGDWNKITSSRHITFPPGKEAT